MSRNPEAGVINDPGVYTFKAKLPKDWIVTSGNEEEEIEFGLLSNSPAGIIAKEVITPIGIAPKTYITGKITEATNLYTIDVIKPDGTNQTLKPDMNKKFKIFGTVGTYRFIKTHKENKSKTTLELDLGYHPVILSDTFFLDDPQDQTGREVFVDYDKLIRTNNIYEIPSGYEGIQWKNWVITHRLFYKGNGYVNSCLSSEFVAYNSSGHPGTIWYDKPFDF
jgi:hypothetical protein